MRGLNRLGERGNTTLIAVGVITALMIAVALPQLEGVFEQSSAQMEGLCVGVIVGSQNALDAKQDNAEAQEYQADYPCNGSVEEYTGGGAKQVPKGK